MYQSLRFGILFLFMIVAKNAFGQWLIEGVLREKKTGQPIAFATVGIRELSIGTATNADGTFALKLEEKHLDETLEFSAIGYHPLSIPVARLVASPNTDFYLEEKVTQLNEVMIKEHELPWLKGTTIGNLQYNTGTMRLDENSNGGSMALRVSHDKYPYRIIKAKLWITHNSLPSFKVRVRVVAVEPGTGMPGHDLMEENVVTTSKIKSGWLEFNLAAKNLLIKQDFFIVFEWVMDKTDRQLLARQVKNHLMEAPESLTSDTLTVGNNRINERTIKDFKSGVWFGTLLHPKIGEQYTCYYRLNSLDDWKLSAAKLTAGVIFYQ